MAPIAAQLPLAAVAAALLACPPYLTAWLKTGNPVFPFFNSVFQSPYYETNASFTNPLFVHPIDPTLWLDFTFRTTRFLESAHEGALGIAVFVLLPAGLLAAVLRRQWTVLALGTAGLVFCLLVFSGTGLPPVRVAGPALAARRRELWAGWTSFGPARQRRDYRSRCRRREPP